MHDSSLAKLLGLLASLQGRAFWATEDIDAQDFLFDVLQSGQQKCFHRELNIQVKAQRLGVEKK